MQRYRCAASVGARTAAEHALECETETVPDSQPMASAMAATLLRQQ